MRGYADLVAAQLTMTPERAQLVTFSRPTATVSEWLVGRKGDPDLPRRVGDLVGREVHVRRSSSFVRTLRELDEELHLKLGVIYVEEERDTESIVHDVSLGRRPLTVVDSNQLTEIESYNTDVARLFPIAEGRQVGWAIRKENPELLAAADSFVIGYFVTEHSTEPSTGDLGAIEQRGSIRVLTRNNSVNYFLYRGRLMGFDYELAEMAARDLGVRLEMVVPPRFADLIPWLLEGRGDVIAASMTITPDRQEQIAFTRPYLYVHEVIVEPADAVEPLRSLEDLTGREIHVQRSTSYYRTLQALQDSVGPFTIVEASEELEIEDLVAAVGEGTIPLTVADSHLLDAELAYRDDVQPAVFLPSLSDPDSEEGAHSNEIAFGTRKHNPELRAFLDRFIAKSYRGLAYNVIFKRYFQNSAGIRRAKERRASETGSLTPYDNLIKKYSKQYNLDWRLMAAQAFRESRFDPQSRSWAGAVGLFQLMPRTAQELGFEDIRAVESNTHAGIRYMSLLLSRADQKIPLKHRIRFAVAAYNAGEGHVKDARRLATRMGWDADRWFGQTEKAMLLLEQPRYHRTARFGYVRGSEVVAYVSRVQLTYDHYVRQFPP
jgi:membrane-bound lytic murein transglycosylase F